MKRIAFCFDGSWNELHAVHPTNVVLIAESIRPTARDWTTQIVYYDEGVGTGQNDTVRGGAFGMGLVVNMREAYRFLIFNYEPGDEIYVFGFSRGAFTARSFVGFIRHVGILDINSARQINRALELYQAALDKDGDDHPDALAFRAEHSSKVCISEYDEDWRCENWPDYVKGSAPILKIKYVGVWDTVAALGWPSVLPFAKYLNRKRGFHDVKLTSKVESARHALAIDERRKLFRPTVWNNVANLNSQKGVSTYAADAPYQQRWFPGVHGSVGGGGPIRGLSDGALAWILAGARRAGLEVIVEDTSRVYEIAPNSLAPLQNDPDRSWHDRGWIGAIKHFLLNEDRDGPTDVNDVSASARRRWNAKADDLPEKAEYRPATLCDVAEALNKPLMFDGIEVKSFDTYVTKGDDTLSKIAKTYWGDPMLYEAIFEANRDILDDPRELQPGLKLRIPPKPDS